MSEGSTLGATIRHLLGRAATVAAGAPPSPADAMPYEAALQRPHASAAGPEGSLRLRHP